MNKKISIKKNIVLNMFRTMMTLVFPLITFPYSSRVLMPDGLGKANFASSVVSYFALFAGLGISSYAIREAAKIRNNKEELSHFSQEILLLNFISTIFAYGLFLVSIFLIPKFSPYRSLLLVYSSTILFTFIGIDWLYTAEEDFAYITIRSFIFQIISIICLFTFVKSSDDILQYAIISVFANVGSNICNFIHSKTFISFKITKKINIGKHIKPVLLLFSLVLTSSIYNMLDTTMVGLLANDYQVGLYSAATKINRIVLSMVVSMGSVLLPRLSYLAGNEDKEEFNKLAYMYLECVLLLAFPCAMGLSILREPLILLLSGEKYIEAIPTMVIMNPVIIVIGISNFLGVQVFFPLGKEKWTLYSDICGAIVNFTLNFLLIPKLASIGAAIGTICAETIVTLIQILFARKIVDVRIIGKCLIKYFLYSLIMAIPVTICSLFITNNVTKLIICVLLGIIIYAFVLYITKNLIFMKVFDVLKSKIKRSFK